jgi:hypothetical protein
VEGRVDWPKNGSVKATNPRSQGKREGRKGKVPTPRDGKRCRSPKPMEAKTEQTKQNESPKVRDVTLNRADRCLGVLRSDVALLRNSFEPIATGLVRKPT